MLQAPASIGMTTCLPYMRTLVDPVGKTPDKSPAHQKLSSSSDIRKPPVLIAEAKSLPNKSETRSKSQSPVGSHNCLTHFTSPAGDLGVASVGPAQHSQRTSQLPRPMEDRMRCSPSALPLCSRLQYGKTLLLATTIARWVLEQYHICIY